MIFLGSFSSTTDGELEILWSTWETENFRSESLELLVEEVEDLVLDEDISFIGSIGDSIVAFLKHKYKLYTQIIHFKSKSSFSHLNAETFDNNEFWVPRRASRGDFSGFSSNSCNLEVEVFSLMKNRAAFCDFCFRFSITSSKSSGSYKYQYVCQKLRKYLVELGILDFLLNEIPIFRNFVNILKNNLTWILFS